MKLKPRYFDINTVAEKPVIRTWAYPALKVKVEWHDNPIWILPKAEHILDKLSDEQYETFMLNIFGILESLGESHEFCSAFVTLHQGYITINFAYHLKTGTEKKTQ